MTVYPFNAPMNHITRMKELEALRDIRQLSNEPVSTVIDATEWTHYSKSACVWVILDIPRQVSRHQSRNELGRRDGGTQER